MSVNALAAAAKLEIPPALCSKTSICAFRGFASIDVMMLAMNISDQLKSQMKKLATAIPGRHNGRKIFQKNLPKLYPSVKAVSSISLGIEDIKLVNNQTDIGTLKML